MEIVSGWLGYDGGISVIVLCLECVIEVLFLEFSWDFFVRVCGKMMNVMDGEN